MEQALEKPRKPPSVGMYIATLLELAMLACFAWNGSFVGAAIWGLYLYYSATWALVHKVWKE